MEYYVYILRCQDNSLYTGITTDVERRYEEHKNGRGAKYTKSKKILKLETFFKCDGRSNASKVEYFIKQLPKVKKEEYLNKINEFQRVVMEKIGVKIEVEKKF